MAGACEASVPGTRAAIVSLTILNVAYPFAPVGPDAVGGAEQVLSVLDHALVESGHRSIVVACEGSNVAGELVPVPVEPANIDESARQRAWGRHRSAIASVLEAVPVDLVHLHGIDFHQYVPEAAPTLATLHLPLDWYPQSIWRPRKNLWLHGVSASQHRTRPAGATLLPPIPNGVSPKLFETRQRKRDFAMVLSRICPEKGIHLALQACRTADIPLIIGGQVFPYETHQRYFEEQVAPLLDGRRRFLGPLRFDRKRRLLSAARCVIVPSLVAETSSLTAIEALACGTPVIAFPNGALPEVVEHGRTGFIVSNTEDMANAIDSARNISPENCRKAAAGRFSLSAMTAGYLEAYGLLALKRGKRSGWLPIN